MFISNFAFVCVYSSANENGQVAPVAVLKLQAELGLSDADDFGVLLGIAERLREGTYAALADVANVEEQMVDMFESF